jgi:hypothetical protein
MRIVESYRLTGTPHAPKILRAPGKLIKEKAPTYTPVWYAVEIDLYYSK